MHALVSWRAEIPPAMNAAMHGSPMYCRGLGHAICGSHFLPQVDVLHAGEHIQLILPTKGIMEESQLVVKIRDLLITRPTTKVYLE